MAGGHWLLKTEPEEWSWEHQQANGGVSQWDGVRNALAQKHLRAMGKGDLCFFYHSGTKAKEIVGIARVCKTFYPDPSDPTSKHGMVDIEAVSKLALPLPLARLKHEDGLHSFIMFRQPRLSVVPVSSSEWDLICGLAGELESPPSLGDGEAQLSSHSSDSNDNTRTDECGLTLSNMIENPSQLSSMGARKRSVPIDGSGAKATGAVLTEERQRPHGKARVANVEIAPTFHEERGSKVPECSRAELIPSAKRVYSRRNTKPRQLPSEETTSTLHQNVQSGVDQEAGDGASMPVSAKLSGSRAMVSAEGRVYKKRERRRDSAVLPLPCR